MGVVLLPTKLGGQLFSEERPESLEEKRLAFKDQQYQKLSEVTRRVSSLLSTD